ncbi:hypothetical protein M885DRAFT_263013 [Pelagophyceae sp. CCMP2097]|nr:hypothetical protein M885DRAFT_263013 [Pelagophyceae sp. CCMP2097]
MEALCISTLADECGGWYRLSWRAWRKYVKRKTQKRGALARADAWAAARTVAPNRAGAEARVNADAAPAAWHRPLATVDEVVLDEDGSDGDDAAPASAAEPAAAYVTGVEEDDELLMVIDERPAAGGPAALAAFRWRPTAAERDAARVQAALLLRAREASATYFLHQKQSHATRERGSRAGLRALDAPAPPSNRGKWIEAQGPGFVKRQAETLGGAAQLAHFPALKLLELASRTWHALFGFYATATLVVVEFYLTDDAPRRREPVIAVDP